MKWEEGSMISMRMTSSYSRIALAIRQYIPRDLCMLCTKSVNFFYLDNKLFLGHYPETQSLMLSEF